MRLYVLVLTDWGAWLRLAESFISPPQSDVACKLPRDCKKDADTRGLP